MVLTDLRVDLTSYCDQHCTFCPFHGDDGRIKKGSFIEVVHHIQVAEELASAGYQPRVRLVGSGEPTLYPHFEEIVRTYKRLGFSVKLITNGQHLSQKRETISSIDSLVLSVHGDEKTHNAAVNNNKSYQRILQGIRDVREHNLVLPITLHFVITPQNYLQMEPHAELASGFKTTPRYQHLVFTEQNQLLGTFDIEALKAGIKRVREKYPTARFVPELSDEDIDRYYDMNVIFIPERNTCRRIVSDLNIRYDGVVIMCDDNVLGDITKESILDILRGPRAEFVQKKSLRAREVGLPDTCSRCCYK